MIRYNTEIIENGDYAAENGAIQLGDYTLLILQDLARAAATRRGSFYPDKNYGGFYAEGKLAVPLQLYAAARARQALYPLGGIYVDCVEISGNSLILKLTINNEKRQVEITL